MGREAKKQEAEIAKKFRETKKAVDEAISMRNRLQEFQDAMASNPPQHEYVSQMNVLLVARSKQMMQEGMNWLLVDEDLREEVSFTFADVKEVMTDLATKTRMLIYLSASRVSLYCGLENAVTTALMVSAWSVVP